MKPTHPHSPSSRRKGIILAGGSGTRLHPLTITSSKQLLPVYDKPMIFYPLSTLMAAGISDIAIITTPEHRDQFRALLGDGQQWGIDLTYIVQPNPEGLAQAYLLAEAFLDQAPSALILGDNLFHGDVLPKLMALTPERGGTVFGYQVPDPHRFGVVELGKDGKALSIEEKPAAPKSNSALTGLYLLDGRAPAFARSVLPSDRGELEITSVLQCYLDEGDLSVSSLGTDVAWLDTGTMDSLLDAARFIETMQRNMNRLVGSPEAVAFKNGWIDRTELAIAATQYRKSNYGTALLSLLETRDESSPVIDTIAPTPLLKTA